MTFPVPRMDALGVTDAARRAATSPRTGRAMRAKPLLSLATLLLFAGCSSTPTEPSPSPESSVAQSAPSAASSEASELEGVWHTGVVTRDDMRRALQDAGLQEYIQPFFAFWKPGETNVFTLRVFGGHWRLYWSKDGGTAVEEDSGPYTISGDTVSISHNDTEGSDTHRWSVNGDTLTITYLSDTIDAPVPHGEEVYQRVLYMSSPWTRGTP